MSDKKDIANEEFQKFFDETVRKMRPDFTQNQIDSYFNSLYYGQCIVCRKCSSTEGHTKPCIGFAEFVELGFVTFYNTCWDHRPESLEAQAQVEAAILKQVRSQTPDADVAFIRPKLRVVTEDMN